MQDLYIYVDKNIASDCLKYGLKLSENCNKVLSLSTGEKSGILAYLAPKDSPLYLDDNYTCIRVKTDGIKATVYNKVCAEIVIPKLRTLSRDEQGAYLQNILNSIKDEPDVLRKLSEMVL